MQHRPSARSWRDRALTLFAALCALSGPLTVWAAPLTLAIARTPLSLPLYVAQAEGYFADAGLVPKIVDCSGGHRCLQLVLDGVADIATAADSPIMFRSFERDDYVVIGTFATASDDVKLVARRSAGIASPRQLQGQKVGVVRGSSSQFFLDSYLLWHDIDPGSVNLIALQADEIGAAMRSGKVAAAAIWEPIAFDTIATMKGDASVLPHSAVYTLSFNLVAHRRLAGARDAELVKLLRAVARAEAFIQSHPVEAQAILRKQLGVDQRFIDWVWPGLHFGLVLDQSLVKTLESEARWAIREGHVAGKTVPDFLRYLHPAPLREVDANAVSVSR
jgi:ABC-type nitrate/sulfonate/bicarbonate transport system substrate-binding protein